VRSRLRHLARPACRRALATGLLLLAAAGTGCTRHVIESTHQVNVAPVEVKPIHITIDINIKVDRELEEFFSDIDQAAGSQATGSAQPTGKGDAR